MAEGTIVFNVPGLPSPAYTWYKIVGDLDGDQTPLVILHGGPGACHDYLLPLVDLSVPLIFYDQIGNGKSTHLPEKNGDEAFWSVDLFKNELDNLLQRLGLDNRPIDLYGHSWGGMLAAEWAVTASASNLRRLIISNSLASMDAWRIGITSLRSRLPAWTRAVLDKAEETGDFSSPEYEAAIELFYKRHLSLARPWPAPEVQAALDWFAADATTYGTMYGPSELSITGSLRNWTIIPLLHRISVPTLLMNAVHDEAQDVAMRPFFEHIKKCATDMPPSPSSIKPKSRRVTQACDFCHQRGVKCKPAPESSSRNAPASCLTCVEYDQECTRRRQPKRRGTKPKNATRLGQRDNPKNQVHDAKKDDVYDYSTVPSSGQDNAQIPTIRSRRIITALLDVYLDTIHPIFPFFCEREIWVGWRDGSFPRNAADFMSLTCMCALSAQHVGSGALFSDDVPATESASLAQDFLSEAKKLVPLDFETPCIDQIRSYGMLALLGAQSSDNAMAHKYIGLYHGLCAHWNLYDESQWPKGISDCETEVRRRLWWIFYRLEVHTACVFGSMIRSPEAQCSVDYPIGTHHPPFIPGRDGEFEDWFAGWNSTTDLYRALEHVIVDFRIRRRPRTSVFGSRIPGQTSTIRKNLSHLQDQILPHFKSVSSRSSDSGRNRCGFQAANILFTIHLGRMISTLGDGDFQSAGQTAAEMMTTVSAIPIEYIRAIGSPLLQQVAGVGHMLARVASTQELSQSHQAECHTRLQQSTKDSNLA
ncbi:L-amino acid amidase [Paramyrothecium foliicola]|nr:L-amino acid amidase [Paramyrothecium foliicola]